METGASLFILPKPLAQTRPFTTTLAWSPRLSRDAFSGSMLTLRTNWEVYAREFLQALRMNTVEKVEMNELKLKVNEAFTPFERKYIQSEHALSEVVARL